MTRMSDTNGPSRVPDCSQAADPTPSIASGSCLESSQLHFSGSLPGFRHFQQAGPASTVSGDRITFLLTKIAIEQADFIDLPFLLCFRSEEHTSELQSLM